MMMLALLVLAIWVYLVLAHGGFWRANQRLPEAAPGGRTLPGVVAIIPARDEAATVGRTVAALLAQDYAGPFRVIVVDDNSSDTTAQAARDAAIAAPDRLMVITGRPLKAGWTGKLWAVHQGVEGATEAVYLWLTDADIEHGPGTLTRLVAKAQTDNLDLVSLMVRLRADSFWERLLIPAFVYFFQMLFPFPRVNDPAHGQAAAAGGCMLVRRAALDQAGGIAAIRDRVIDDCALAALLKPDGAIWLGLTETSHSHRALETLGGIWAMVARTAFIQLDHSALALVGTLAGMSLLYLAPPALTIWGLAGGGPDVLAAGAGAWALMILTYAPTLRLYDQSPIRGLLLPLVALLYTLMTLDSARLHWQGQGGAWKGRTYAK